MRALTIRQPWAWAVIHGGKDVENRSVAWSYRGPLAVHAGNAWSWTGQRSPLIRAAATAALGDRWANRDNFAFGAIIGVVDLVDVHYAEPDAVCCDSQWVEARYRDQQGHEIGTVTHLALENPRALGEPIVCRGRLGLWAPDAGVLAELEAHL